MPLYKTIVMLHLEYYIQAWRPYRKKDIATLERIQRRATKIIPDLRYISYEERLKESGLSQKYYMECGYHTSVTWNVFITQV